MRPAVVWLVFGLCVAAVMGAMVWSSASVLRLERAEHQARAQAALEENARLALWRLDSALMPLLARETARPFSDYAPDPPALSPLARDTPAEILLHFQVAPGGQVTSPQVPPAELREVALRQTTLGVLGERSRAAGIAALRAGRRRPGRASAPGAGATRGRTSAWPRPSRRTLQKMKNVQEYVARQQTFEKNALVAAARPRPSTDGHARGSAHRASGSATRSCWRGAWAPPAASTFRAAGWTGHDCAGSSSRPCRTSCLGRSWSRSRRERARTRSGASPPCPCASSRGRRRTLVESGASPARLSLAGAWLAMLLAAAAVAALLRGVLELSERRRVFVSAVTHELRTPLTTFRLYTDMLAEDMVTPESRRREYIARLRSEAERLGHLVENVLFYARVETGRGGAARELVDLRALLEDVRPRLAERAVRANMEVAWERPPAEAALVEVDRSAVEQVLLNLVDNACKYAGASTPPRIHVALETADGRALLRVSDHGPGISRSDRRRLFQPFSKSDREAASSAPGIGLGLALSRRLARAQGGDLYLESRRGRRSRLRAQPAARPPTRTLGGPDLAGDDHSGAACAC